MAQWEFFCSYLQFSWLNTITGSTLLRIAPGYVDCSLLLTVLNNSGTVLLTQERIASFLLVKHSIPSSAINTKYFQKDKIYWIYERHFSRYYTYHTFQSKSLYGSKIFLSIFHRISILSCDSSRVRYHHVMRIKC